ncbi:MAG: NUDIX domain-containing protein [bacterium]|nr:NUDIX domain-containing protein [bacterium]
MADLQSLKAKICITAAGVLIHQQRVLLIKHKKVGFWLNPGGHVESNELPHRAAEREFWEETAIDVKARPYGMMWDNPDSEYVPSPFSTNIHWACQDNYVSRVNNMPPTEYAKKHWKKGCEQHLNALYLMEPVGSVVFKENVEETDGIAWFTLKEVENLDTAEQIKQEVKFAFSISAKK